MLRDNITKTKRIIRLLISADKRNKLNILRQELLAVLNDHTGAARRTTDELLRIELDGYLFQQVCEPHLIEKCSANPLLFWKDNGKHYQLLQSSWQHYFLACQQDQYLLNAYFLLLV